MVLTGADKCLLKHRKASKSIEITNKLLYVCKVKNINCLKLTMTLKVCMLEGGMERIGFCNHRLYLYI